MPDCEFTITASGALEVGKTVTFSVSPPLQAGCEARMEIDGVAVSTRVGGEIGRLHVNAAGAGVVSVTPTSVPVHGVLTVTMRCTAPARCGPTPRSRALELEGTSAPREIVETVALVLTGPAWLVFWIAARYVGGPPELVKLLRSIANFFRDLFPSWLKALM